MIASPTAASESASASCSGCDWDPCVGGAGGAYRCRSHGPGYHTTQDGAGERRRRMRLRGPGETGRRGATGGRRARWTSGRGAGTASRNRRGWPTDGDPKEGPWVKADGAPCTQYGGVGQGVEQYTDTAVWDGELPLNIAIRELSFCCSLPRSSQVDLLRADERLGQFLALWGSRVGLCRLRLVGQSPATLTRPKSAATSQDCCFQMGDRSIHGSTAASGGRVALLPVVPLFTW
jgi:hypothetical protein